jgi:nicotinamidase-related amidase
MVQIPDDAVLLLVDVQKGFDDPAWGRRSNPGAEGNMARLLEAWRRTGRVVVHVRHLSTEEDSPLRAERPGAAIKKGFEPLEEEPLLEKSVNSAFIGTGLQKLLEARGARTLVIAGFTTDHCISTTARMAGNLGYWTVVAGDATATFERTGPDGRHYDAQLMHDAALASLHGEFAAVVDTEAILRAAEVEGRPGASGPEEP